MKKKRLNRDAWGFHGFPYYQMRMDTEDFHGLVSMINLIDGDYYYWDLTKAGKTPVCGKGMCWLQMIPDNKHRVITAKFLPKSGVADNVEYHKTISIWYVDVIDSWGYDPDGVAYFIDEYLDVIFDLEGDIKLDDQDELEEAYHSGELSTEQYEQAIEEGKSIMNDLCSNVEETGRWCERILEQVQKRVELGEVDKINRHHFMTTTERAGGNYEQSK